MANILYQVSLYMSPPTATHHAKQIVTIPGKGARLIDSKGLRGAKRDYTALIQGTYHGEPIDTPVALLMRFVFPYPKATAKKVVKAGGMLWKATKPDLDNLLKTPGDVLTGCGILRDDSRVVARAEVKCYGPEPKVDIVLLDMSGMTPQNAWDLISVVWA